MKSIIFIFVVSILSLLADVLLKRASDSNGTKPLLMGVVLYMINAVFWFIAYKYSKFSTVGVVYSLLTIFASIGVGIIMFRDRIVFREVLGIVFGIIALVLLSGKTGS